MRAFEELHEPGVSACEHCGALHGSEARFCPSCGTAVDPAGVSGVELPGAAPAPEPAPEAEQPTQDAPPADAGTEPEQPPAA